MSVLRRAGMRLLPALLVFVALEDTARADVRTCQSGRTVYAAQGVRVFEDGRGQDDQWFACRPGSRRPKEVFRAGAGLANFAVEGRDDDRVVFHGTVFGEGGGASVEIGWFDAGSSRVRTGLLATENQAELLDTVVAPDGGIGVAAQEEESPARVGYLAPSRTAGDLRTEIVLASVGGRLRRDSLAFGSNGDSLSWTLRGRTKRSVPLTGERPTCQAGTTLEEIGGTRLFEVIRTRRAQRALLLSCGPGATAPRVLAGATLGELWKIGSVKRSGTRAVFRAGPTGVGSIDAATGTLRFSTVEDLSVIDDVAVGSGGAVVLAGENQERQRIVARLPEAAGSFGAPERLATIGGELVAGTLAIGDDARIRWRTESGARSVPLAGETTVTCAAGTPLHEAAGLRVFEVLPAGSSDARLLACPPSADTPVLLATGSRDQSWTVRVIARENGRAALVAVMISGESRREEMISFAGAAGSARRGALGDSAAYADIRDAAVAGDGRVGVAVRSLGTWRIGYFAPGSTPATLRRERRLATPQDGLRPGSLAFAADGARLEWRSRTGRPRSVSLPAPSTAAAP